MSMVPMVEKWVMIRWSVAKAKCGKIRFLFGYGGTAVKIASLSNIPSVPGPVYFDAG